MKLSKMMGVVDQTKTKKSIVLHALRIGLRMTTNETVVLPFH